MTGAFVQASFRSSAAVMGLAFIQNLYGQLKSNAVRISTEEMSRNNSVGKVTLKLNLFAVDTNLSSNLKNIPVTTFISSAERAFIVRCWISWQSHVKIKFICRRHKLVIQHPSLLQSIPR
mgnify:CR=1 FL=1